MIKNNEEVREEGMHRLNIASLRSHQEAPVEAILNHHDVIVLMPTSGGKSLLYQLPAVMDGEGKLTLVVSPLKALQVDQVKALCEKGIRTAVLNSDLSPSEHCAVLIDMTLHGSLLYLAPEQLQNPAVIEALRTARLSRIAVDEAHVLSQAKDDFRKAYGKIGKFIQMFPQRLQVLALTATATRKDVSRIRKSLGIPDADLFRTPMRRNNLHLSIKRLDNGKSGKGKRKLFLETVLFHAVERALERWDNNGVAIVYCPTVRRVRKLCK